MDLLTCFEIKYIALHMSNEKRAPGCLRYIDK